MWLTFTRGDALLGTYTASVQQYYSWLLLTILSFVSFASEMGIDSLPRFVLLVAGRAGILNLLCSMKNLHFLCHEVFYMFAFYKDLFISLLENPGGKIK